MRNAALLIGNSRYDPLPPLRTPIGDVRNLAASVRRLGFDVEVVEDAGMHALSLAVARFREKVAGLAPGGSIFVYFAGHGVQSAGENYLIPVDAVAPTGGGWRLRALDLSSLLEELCWRPDQQKLIALDACRTNGIASIARSSGLGLGVSKECYAGVCETMILHAAKPGQIASDGSGLAGSPFCQALLDIFEGKGRPLPLLAPEITRNTKSYTGGEQIPWHTHADLTEMALVPFWEDLESPNDPKRLRDHAPVAAAATTSAPIGPSLAISHQLPGPRRGYSTEEIAAKPHLVHKLKARDTTGRWAYYFVLVEEAFERSFLIAIEGDGEVDMEQYGVVIASCYGEEPSAEVCDYLYRTYGFQVETEFAVRASAPPLQRNEYRDTRPVVPNALVALRQQMGRSQWRWMVLWVLAENRMRLFEFADALLEIDRRHQRPRLDGIMGGLLDTVLGTPVSAFKLDELAKFGTIICRGDGRDVPHAIRAELAKRFGAVFDWSDWQRLNGAVADIPGAA